MFWRFISKVQANLKSEEEVKTTQNNLGQKWCQESIIRCCAHWMGSLGSSNCFQIFTCFNNIVIIENQRKSSLTLGSGRYATPRSQGKWLPYNLVMQLCTLIWCSQGYFRSRDLLLLNLSSTGDGTEYLSFNFLWSPETVGELVICELMALVHPWGFQANSGILQLRIP